MTCRQASLAENRALVKWSYSLTLQLKRAQILGCHGPEQEGNKSNFVKAILNTQDSVAVFAANHARGVFGEQRKANCMPVRIVYARIP